MCHAVGFERLLRALAEEPQHLLVWLDEAHELPEETLAEARALAESDLEASRRVQILLVGLPKLRAALQAQPPAVAAHRRARGTHRSALRRARRPSSTTTSRREQRQRLDEPGLTTLFERAKGLPGLLLPMARAVFARTAGALDPHTVDDTLERWELA